MPTLKDQVAVVAGGSRGIGKGIALALGEAHATVYVAGRTATSTAQSYHSSVFDSAAGVQERGGVGIGVICDFTDDRAVSSLFGRVFREQGRLDILVIAVFPDPILPLSVPRSISGKTPRDTPFWQLPIAYWDELHRGSLRAYYLACMHASPMMVKQGRGTIIGLSSGGATQYWLNVPYGVDKAGVEKLIADAATELSGHGVTVLAVRPPLTATEAVVAGALETGASIAEACSPLYTGRVISALATDPQVMQWSGSALEVDAMASYYGIPFVGVNEPR